MHVIPQLNGPMHQAQPRFAAHFRLNLYDPRETQQRVICTDKSGHMVGGLKEVDPASKDTLINSMRNVLQCLIERFYHKNNIGTQLTLGEDKETGVTYADVISDERWSAPEGTSHSFIYRYNGRKRDQMDYVRGKIYRRLIADFEFSCILKSLGVRGVRFRDEETGLVVGVEKDMFRTKWFVSDLQRFDNIMQARLQMLQEGQKTE